MTSLSPEHRQGQWFPINSGGCTSWGTATTTGAFQIWNYALLMVSLNNNWSVDSWLASSLAFGEGGPTSLRGGGRCRSWRSEFAVGWSLVSVEQFEQVGSHWSNPLRLFFLSKIPSNCAIGIIKPATPQLQCVPRPRQQISFCWQNCLLLTKIAH